MNEEEIETSEDTEEEITAIEQVEIPFLEDLLLAARATDGEIYVPVIPFCRHLGLGKPKGQITRIRNDDTLHEGLKLMAIKTAGGRQGLQSLRIDMLTLWLASIQENIVKESIRPALSRYKREAARAILAYFTARAQTDRALATTPNKDVFSMPASNAPVSEWASYHEMMAALYHQLERQQGSITSHEERLNTHEREIIALSEDMIGVREALAIMSETPEPRISIAQANQIQALVSKIHEATKIHQGTIFAAFKKEWRIPRYDELPVAQFDKAFEWLRQWGRAQLPRKQ